MTLASWNVNSLNVRLQHVRNWLESNPVDVLGIQELKLIDEKFPTAAFAEAGYQTAAFGQPTYNGVAIAHRHEAQDIERNIPGYPDSQSRVISATLNMASTQIRLVNAYFVNGQEPGSEKFAYKLEWLAHLERYVAEQLAQHQHVVLMGDFNITASDQDSWDPNGLKETIHHTTIERQALLRLLALGMLDSFRAFEQAEKSFSWWDYRMLGFQKNRGLRIDYVLISESLRPALTRSWIDRAPRKWPKPSDHAPVLVELDMARLDSST
ncbi:exodeoxyribonuclease III [Lampropedia puyangensis]|uniref:Exodeoxyribonuclease III n=1 Tax=Lampropedia puyangensis TaxID=1330072 RepID=A0A4S8F9D0_9BURK|nr:exodeoxyribonuclease III [Lampropedia puyangensis]THU02072.1 exodeoxyribonuclease III [Lampropedia puyangensis]